MASSPHLLGAPAILAVGCTLGAAALLSFGDWSAGEVNASPNSDHVHSASVRSAPSLPDQVQGDRRPVTVQPSAGSSSLSAPQPSAAALMLDSYYGADAGAVRAALADRGIDLDTLTPPVPEAEFQTFLPHWMAMSADERESRKLQERAWPEPLTNEFLQAKFDLVASLGPAELATIDSLAKLYTPDIDAAVDQYFDHLDVAFATELDAGRVLSTPFLAWPPAKNDPDSHERAEFDTAFYSLIRAGQGWIVRAALHSEQHPEAFAARGSVAEAVGIRDHALAESIAHLQR